MTAPDRFTAFVDLLAAHLGEHPATADEMAATAFWSRSHLDRVVKATTGETPAAFRRRILLERAAHRLRAEVRVVDAAVEAGYASHEAFTRAFARAFGSTPSAWRTSGASPRLPSPNDVHFHPPGGLVLPPRTEVRQMNVLADMVDHHRWAVGELISAAEALAGDRLDQPVQLAVGETPMPNIDADPTIRSVLSRLVGQLDMWNQAVADEPYDFAVEQDETLVSMRSRLVRAGEAFAVGVRAASDEVRMDEAFVDATGDRPYVFTRAAVVAHVLTYAAHRRTLVAGALAALGAGDVDLDPLDWFGAGYQNPTHDGGDGGPRPAETPGT